MTLTKLAPPEWFDAPSTSVINGKCLSNREALKLSRRLGQLTMMFLALNRR